MRIAALRNPIRDYAWGSPSAIPDLLGTENPGGGPQAELWMGAHPAAPSKALVDGHWIPVPDWIERDPGGVLGADVASRFGGELPFLFKVLAAAEPLSIQAHPSAAQAREGFAREEARGIPRDAPERCYRDANAKPELLCALTRFEALQGFRPPDDILLALGAVAAPELDAACRALAARPDRAGLRDFFTVLLKLGSGAKRSAVERAAAAGARDGATRALRRVAELARAYPGDVGSLAPLLLHAVSLEPGEALFLAAGEPHCYLEGVGVELMANSDNVLRGGLTSKHVDVDELLRVLTFASDAPRVVLAAERGAGVVVWETPATEFELSRVDVRPGRAFTALAERGVEILLCVEGDATATQPRFAGSTRLSRGDSAIAPAAAGAYRLEGEARLYRARVPFRSLRANGAAGAAVPP